MRAPPGIKVIDFEDLSENHLRELGWTDLNVGIAPLYNYTSKINIKARRKQYGLRHRIAATIHQVMGNTLGKVATEIGTTNNNRLWEKGQLVVLTSRTKLLQDIFFVGDKKKTLDAIEDLLLKRTQYDEYIEHVLDVLLGDVVGNGGVPVIDAIHTSYRPNDFFFPEAGSGVCYLLVSTSDYMSTYIGQTLIFIGERLCRHNSGIGAKQTASLQLRSWALLAIIVGFDGNRQDLREFEKLWEEKRSRAASIRHDLHPMDVAYMAESIIAYSVFAHLQLRLLIVGTLT
jgi:hypothetical protein